MISSKAILKKYQVQPRKRLSQSFLRDDNIAARIVRAAEIDKEDAVLEIGAGHGILTRLIAPVAGEVLAVEIDPNLVAILEKVMAPHTNVRIIPADILKTDIGAFVDCHAGKKLKVIGNIPYAISTEILFQLLSCRRVISGVILMVQKEVAERLTAEPGTKTYGVPTVLLSMFARIDQLFDVPPTCFFPRPRVVSTVISLTFRDQPRVELLSEDFFFRLVKASFAQRRKTLWNNLRNFPGIDAEVAELKSAMLENGLDDHIRAEAINVETLGALSNRLYLAFPFNIDELVKSQNSPI